MTNIATRTFSKILKNRNALRPFFSHFPRQTLSTGVVLKQEAANAVAETSEDLINPLCSPDFFQVHDLFTVKDLFNAKVHYGHKEGSLNDHMRPFVYGSRLGHLIIDLDQTADLLRQALNFAAHIAFRDGIILFIAKNPQTSYIVEKTAKECEEFAHTRKWKMGTFTNSTHEFGAVTRLPDLCIFLNIMESVVHQHKAVVHAAKMGIPSIGIVDTNTDPRLVTYPVPGNDDTPCAVELYCRLFKEAIMRGKTSRNVVASVASQ